MTLGNIREQGLAEPSVVGSWKQVSYFTEELATGKRIALLGEHPKGYLIYTPEGRVMVLGTSEGRSPCENRRGPAQSLKSMVAYSGAIRSKGIK